jgi:UDP-glucose 4-epimerase
MKILITGIAGFIGSHLADALLETGHEVWGIDNLTTGSFDNVPEDASFELGDVRDVMAFPLESWDLIYHCAASYADREAWESDASTNVLGTINVVREAQRTGARLVYFQTSLCYGPNPKSPVQTDARLEPYGSYAVSKTAAESYIRDAGRAGDPLDRRDAGFDWVSLRLANVYGPRNLSGPVPTFYQRLTAGEPVTVVDSRRDFIFVDDLVRLAVAAGTRGNGIYHASTGTDISIYALYLAVTGAMGLDLPEPIVRERAPDDVATLLLDPIDTLLEYGWAANTPLVTGIHEAVEWYQAHPPERTFTHLQQLEGVRNR